MLKLANGKTTILVTHNMYQVLSVDNVVVMSNGSIVEQGEPAELLSNGGQFASMFKEFNGEMPFEIENDFSKTDSATSYQLPSVDILGKLKFTATSRIGEIDVQDGEKLYGKLQARQPFPLSAPQIIILEDQSGNEMMTIPDMEQA